MPDTTRETLAIASAAGGFKGVFAHGVLSAFEAAGIRAGAYAATSSTVFPEIDPATLGAGFTDATDEGLVSGYQHGLEIGRRFVENWQK